MDPVGQVWNPIKYGYLIWSTSVRSVLSENNQIQWELMGSCNLTLTKNTKRDGISTSLNLNPWFMMMVSHKYTISLWRCWRKLFSSHTYMPSVLLLSSVVTCNLETWKSRDWNLGVFKTFFSQNYLDCNMQIIHPRKKTTSKYEK